MKSLFTKILAAAALLALTTTHLRAAETTIIWHGQSAFEIRTPKGKVLWIDPWLNNPLNPAAKDGKDPVAGVTQADYILITHGHFDHVGDAVAIAKKTGAKLVTNPELATGLKTILGYPKDQVGYDTLGNAGEELTIADGEVTVAFTAAVHASGLTVPAIDGKDQPPAYGGSALGFVLMIQDGPTIYHTGDTAYFRDMEEIGRQYAIDLGLINIGGHFGMEPKAAAHAAASVRASLVIPQHFKALPVLAQNTSEFFRELDKFKIAHRELAPGGQIIFVGHKPRG